MRRDLYDYRAPWWPGQPEFTAPDGFRPPTADRRPSPPGPRPPGYGFVMSSTSSSGSRPGVFRSNFVIANRKIA